MNKFICTLFFILLTRPIVPAERTQTTRKNRVCCDLRYYLPAVQVPSYTQVAKKCSIILTHATYGGIIGFCVAGYGVLMANFTLEDLDHKKNTERNARTAAITILGGTIIGATGGVIHGLCTQDE